MNKKKVYYTTVAIIFSVISILHLVRAVNEWEAVVAGADVPVWISWVVFVLAGYLAIRGFQLGAKHSNK